MKYKNTAHKKLVKGIKVIELHMIEIEFECGFKVEEMV